MIWVNEQVGFKEVRARRIDSREGGAPDVLVFKAWVTVAPSGDSESGEKIRMRHDRETTRWKTC